MKTILLIALLFWSGPAFAGNDLLNMYKGYAGDTQMAPDRPHRSASELGAWLSDTVADALVFTPGTSAGKLSSIKTEFSDAGWKMYTDFLAAQGLSSALQTQTLNMSTIVNSTPLLIGQGASAGRYAWAYEMPVVLTAIAAPGQPAATREIILRVQVGRSPKGAAPHGVLIESWQEFREPPAESGGKPQ